MTKSIVITGCSTGFGRATALHLARRGWQVYATVRREADGAGLKEEAAANGCDMRMAPALCDITIAADVEELARTLSERAVKLDALLNNAGTSFAGPLETVRLDDVRAQFEINTLGHLAMIQGLLPLLKAVRGTIINVSSVGGRMTFPINGAYHMSKFALEAMSDVLRVELAPFGVKVVIMEPGGSPTAIWETSLARSRRSHLAGPNGEYEPLISAVERYARVSERNGFPPEVFARAVERILNSRRPPSRYPVPRSAAIMMRIRRWLPDWAWDWGTRRTLRW
jgi:NAD(P)-dependent dehydrogenase (short-subunit alcohol dehydrogenase family)